jgi:MFS transporter, DHA2 family, multidrug resistance protein
MAELTVPGSSARAVAGAAAPWLALTAGGFGTAAYMTTITATGTAIPHMQGAFSAAPDQMVWLLTAFLVGTTIVTACVGWLTDRLGARRFFLWSSGGFAVMTVLCGFSTSLEDALLYRTLQGMFGAALLPLGQSIAMDAFPKERQGLATAMWCTVGNIAPTFGPYVGALLVEEYGWSWVFFVTVPLSVGAFAMTWAFVPKGRPARPTRFDWTGFLLLSVVMAAFIVVLSRGERLEWFASTEIVVMTAVAVVAAYGFLVWMMTVRNPFISPGMFRDFNFALGLFIMFASGCLIWLQLFLMPAQLQILAGYDIAAVGELLIYRGGAFVIGALLMGWVADKLDPRVTLAIGFLMTIVSAWGMSIWSTDVRWFDVAWTIALNGMSSSVQYVPLTVLAFRTLPVHYRAEGVALFYVVMSLGTATGTAVIYNVLTRSVKVNHDVLVEHLTPYNELFAYGFIPRAWNIMQPSGLAGLDAEIARQSLMIAYNNCFLLIAVAGLALIPLGFMLRMGRRRAAA